MELTQLSSAQLRKAADLKERIDTLQDELTALFGSPTDATPAQRVHWAQTPEGKARLAKSMRKSWQSRGRVTGSAKTSSTKTSPAKGKKLHWTQTPEGKIRMDQIRRRRWQKR
jgi:hypothetical protein